MSMDPEDLPEQARLEAEAARLNAELARLERKAAGMAGKVMETTLEAPVIAVPHGFQGSAAEAVALAVAGAMVGLEQERDRARGVAVTLEQQLAQAVGVIGLLVEKWPETSWAQDSHVKALAREFLASLETPGV